MPLKCTPESTAPHGKAAVAAPAGQGSEYGFQAKQHIIVVRFLSDDIYFLSD